MLRWRTQHARTNIPKIVATFIYASSQGHHTHSARTKILLENRNSINTIHLCSPIHVLIMHIHKVSLGKLDLQD